MIRAYRRVSVAKDESGSLDQQTAVITRWAEYRHPGKEIVWYTDEGVSGAKSAKLESRQRLLAELRWGDILVASKLDRFARSTRDLLDIVEHCEKINATLVATEQDLNTSGPYGRFTITLLAALAELERDIVAERIRAARLQFRADGRFAMESLPFGFTAVREGRGLVIRPDKKLSPRIRAAVRAVIDGATLTSQAESLGLTLDHFSKLLRNPRLYGQQPGGKLDLDAAIITMSEWQDLQASLRNGRTWSKASGYAAALSCYQCGRRLYTYRPSKPGQKEVYRCESKHPARPVISRFIADPFIEKAFLSRHGSEPMHQVVVESDDMERQERLAGVEIEIDAATTALKTAWRPELVAMLQRLHTHREAILSEPVSQEVRLVPLGITVGDHWQVSDDDERVKLLKIAMKLIVHPRSRAEGRIEVIDFSPLVDFTRGAVELLPEG